jgi:hypothetical protein
MCLCVLEFILSCIINYERLQFRVVCGTDFRYLESDKEKMELYETLSTIHATNIHTYFAYSMDALMIVTV